MAESILGIAEESASGIKNDDGKMMLDLFGGAEAEQETVLANDASNDDGKMMLDLFGEAEAEQKTALANDAGNDDGKMMLDLFGGIEAEQETALANNASNDDGKMMLDLFDADDDEESALIKSGMANFLEEEENLELKVPRAAAVDKDRPTDSFGVIGNWLKEALDLGNYMAVAEGAGAQAAAYKIAYDEGKMGEFEAGKFSKEAFKAGVRGLTEGNLRLAGGLLEMAGRNLEQKDADFAQRLALPTLAQAIPQAGQVMRKIGSGLKDLSLKVGKIHFLAPSEEAYESEENFMRLANVLGQGASQVLSMSTVARLLGTKAAYGLFAAGGASEVFDETYETSGDLAAADTAAMLNAGATYFIDKMFNPLPKQIEQRMQMTSGQIVREVLVNSPMREAGSEVLQQVVAENMVRKAAVDPETALYEGITESLLGAVAGSYTASGVDGFVYHPMKRLNEAREMLKERGLQKEQIEALETNFIRLLAEHPDVIERVLKQNSEENLTRIGKFSEFFFKKKEEVLEKSVKEDIEKAAEALYGQALEASGNVDSAMLAKNLFATTMLFMHEQDPEISVRKMLEDNRLGFKRDNAESFFAQNKGAPVSYLITGIKALGTDHNALGAAINELEAGADKSKVWQKYHWTQGSDGKYRSEINDQNAEVTLWRASKKEKKKENMFLRNFSYLGSVGAYLQAELLSELKGAHAGIFTEFAKFVSENVDENSFSDTKGAPLDEKTDLEALSPERQALRKKYEQRLLDIVQKYYAGEDIDSFTASDKKYLEVVEEMRLNDELIQKFVGEDGKYSKQMFDAWTQKKAVEIGENPYYNQLIEQIENEANTKYWNLKEYARKARVKLSKQFWESFNLRRDLLVYKVTKAYSDANVKAEFDAYEKDGKLVKLNFAQAQTGDEAAKIAETLRAKLDSNNGKRVKNLKLGEDIEIKKALGADIERVFADERLQAAAAAMPEILALGEFNLIGMTPDGYKVYNATVPARIGREDVFLDVQIVKRRQGFVFENMRLKLTESNTDELIGFERKKDHTKRPRKIKVNLNVDLEYRPIKYEKAFGRDDSQKNTSLKEAVAMAGKERTLAEIFLDQPKYEYLSKDEKRELAKKLDRAKLLYNVMIRLKKIDEKQHRDWQQEMEDESASSIFARAEAQYQAKRKDSAADDGESPAFNKALSWPERMRLSLGKAYNLEDLLSFDEAYFSYPEMRHMKVYFNFLRDGNPFHFYHDKNGEWVMEINPQQVMPQELRGVLLDGLQRAIGSKENFDPYLGAYERKNFMNRLLSEAGLEVFNQMEPEFKKFIQRYLPKVEWTELLTWRRDKIPTTDSDRSGRNILGRHQYSRFTYRTLNTKQIEKALIKYYGEGGEEGEAILKQAFKTLSNLNTRYQRRLRAAARHNGGYAESSNFYGSYLTQESADMRALYRRMGYDRDEREEYLWLDPRAAELVGAHSDISDNLSALDLKLRAPKGQDAGKDHIDIGLYHIMRGAYDGRAHVVTLFDEANAEVIWHEMFHYFSHNMKWGERVGNAYIWRMYSDAMDELKIEFAKKYDVKWMGRGYAAFDRKSGEKLENIPSMFASANDLIYYGAEELFADKFVKSLGEGYTFSEGSSFDELAKMYKLWVFKIAKATNLNTRNVGAGGKKIMRFFKKEKY